VLKPASADEASSFLSELGDELLDLFLDLIYIDFLRLKRERLYCHVTS
jgi:hypothetical protein